MSKATITMHKKYGCEVWVATLTSSTGQTLYQSLCLSEYQARINLMRYLMQTTQRKAG